MTSLYTYLDFVLKEATLSFDYTATSLLTCFHCGSYVKDFDTYLFSYTKILPNNNKKNYVNAYSGNKPA